jgi:hypothetical protein
MHPFYAILVILPLVSTHGILISPPPRSTGEKSLSYCGEEINSILKNDNQTSLNALQIASSTSNTYNAKKCNLLFCRGLQLEDNKHGIQEWVPGQVVELKVWTRIPHTGWMSVAIVEEKSGLLVGGQLGSWETGSVSGYETQDHENDRNSLHKQEDEMKEEIAVDLEFNVTIPKIYPRCAVAGECVSYFLKVVVWRER